MPTGGPAPHFEKAFSLPWSTPFEDPIPLPDGGQLLTLKDAGEYIQSLPTAVQETEPWQTATEALLLVINQNGPAMFARIGMMRALYPRGEPVLRESGKKTHWDKRKLKRDQ